MFESNEDKAFSYEEVAAILGVSRGTVERHYDGPKFKCGSETRIWSGHLRTWVDKKASLDDFFDRKIEDVRNIDEDDSWNPEVSD